MHNEFFVWHPIKFDILLPRILLTRLNDFSQQFPFVLCLLKITVSMTVKYKWFDVNQKDSTHFATAPSSLAKSYKLCIVASNRYINQSWRLQVRVAISDRCIKSRPKQRSPACWRHTLPIHNVCVAKKSTEGTKKISSLIFSTISSNAQLSFDTIWSEC